MKRGDHKNTNLYFRRRLYAQTFTVAVLCAGNAYWQEDRTKRKEYNKLMKEKERIEKRERWLRELEARDEEDKAFKERLRRRRGESVQEDVKETAKGVTDMVREKTGELKEKVTEFGK
jgi:Flp pilus assembly protein TadB